MLSWTHTVPQHRDETNPSDVELKWAGFERTSPTGPVLFYNTFARP